MDYNKFEPLLGSWGASLQPFIESNECDILYAALKADAKRGKKLCPLSENTYRAFKETPLDQLKVVFWLLDPYPQILKDGTRVADGIAMSCSNTEQYQPSLKLFYDAIEDNLLTKNDKNKWLRPYDLKYLCNQGVMMLNTALTVEAGKTGSHTAIWRPFMQYLCEEVFAKKPSGLTFVLCGKVSQEMARWINPLQHRIFDLEHPAFAARKDRAWKYEGIFRTVNYLLSADKKDPIHWMYEEAPF